MYGRAEGAIRMLLVHDWQIDSGYNVQTVRLALQIPGGCSDKQIDLVYLVPSRRPGTQDSTVKKDFSNLRTSYGLSARQAFGQPRLTILPKQR